MLDAFTLLFSGDYEDSQEHLLNDVSFNTMFFSIFENVFRILRGMLERGIITTSLMDK